MSIIEKALEKAVEQSSSKEPVQDLASGPGDSALPVDTARRDVETTKKTAETKRVQIQWSHLEEKGMLLPDKANSQMAEEYRIIKRPLLMNAFPEEENGIENANLILVTSSVPGEGKTFTAVNLALSIAMERDKTVLLVDGDVAKPSISQLLGIESEIGLIDLLQHSDMSFSDALLRTDIPNLTVLPAGRQHRHSTEILASDATKRLARELSERYADRIVIFDSPPLLAAAQGSVLASLVGQVVLVIESEITPQHVVQEAIGKLDACDVIGCVLNKTNKGFGFSYYGYGYGYGHYGQQYNQN